MNGATVLGRRRGHSSEHFPTLKRLPLRSDISWKGSGPMIFVKSTLAGVAAVIIAALVIYGLAVGVPLILERMPSREGGVGVYSVGPFPMWPLGAVALLIFSGGFYWS